MFNRLTQTPRDLSSGVENTILSGNRSLQTGSVRSTQIQHETTASLLSSKETMLESMFDGFTIVIKVERRLSYLPLWTGYRDKRIYLQERGLNWTNRISVSARSHQRIRSRTI